MNKDDPEWAMLNDCAKRVHTVMCVSAEKVALARPEKSLSHTESMAVLNGAASGIAVFASQMQLTKSPDAAPDAPSPEEYLADILREQFLSVYRSQGGDEPVAAVVTDEAATTTH